MGDRLAIVLAAGKGTRMNSDLPKVLCEVCGRPMIEYVLDALRASGVGRIVIVVGYGALAVQQQLGDAADISFVEQNPQRGTGHAVMVCQDEVRQHEGPILVVTGDSPMVSADSLRMLMDEIERRGAACVLATCEKENPDGLGRIVRDANGDFVTIVEQADADEAQRQIHEVNISCYVFRHDDLFDALGQLETDNAQGELYITDCPHILKRAGKEVVAIKLQNTDETLSVNTLEELAVVEAAMRAKGRG